MATRRGRFILLALALLVLASLWRTVAVEREKRRLATAYEQARRTLTQLEKEHAQLNTELADARQTIQKQTGDMANLQQELKGLDARLEQATTELTALQHEHEQLRLSNASLSSQLSTLATEKQQLEAKLSSIRELKLAIRDVRRKMWEQRLAAWRAHIHALKEADRERLASGNRGYLVRAGVPTSGSRAKLQVHVLQPQSQ